MKFLQKPICMIICAAVLFLTVAFSPGRAQAAIPTFEEAVIVAEGVNMRLRPTVDSPVVLQMRDGTRVGVFCEEVDGWYRIIYGNYRGYVSKDYVFLPSTDVLVGNVLNDETPVYQNAGEFSEQIDMLNAGVGVTITSMLGDYYGVEYLVDSGPATDSGDTATTGEDTTDATADETAAPEDAESEQAQAGQSNMTFLSAADTLPEEQESEATDPQPEGAPPEASGEQADPEAPVEQDLSSDVETQNENMQRGYILKETVKTSNSKNAANMIKEGMQGVEVIKLQRELLDRGFMGESATGEFGEKTKKAVMLFQQYAELPEDGIAGKQTLEMLYGDNDIRITYAQRMGISGEVHLTPWSEMQHIWPKESTAKITDVATGISWTEYRFGGWHHVDTDPYNAEDTEKMKEAVGEWTWDRRAIWVTIDGVTHAASMNCMPHLSNARPDNNFGGHHCIHFYESKVHENDKECPRHQAMVQLAYKRGQFE